MIRILISAGEVSGDRLGAQVADALRRRHSDCELFGLGGARMAAAGVDLVASTTELGASGVTEALAVASRLAGCWRRLRGRVRQAPPDAALLIGNDIFHVWVARRLRTLGVPTVVCFPPLVWVWSWLSGFIGRSFDTVLTSFPDEERIYRAAGAHVVPVGHYLIDTLAPVTAEERARARGGLGVPQRSRVVTLLPGSRVHEVELIGAPLVDAAVRLAARDRDMHVLLPLADDWLRPHVLRVIEASRGAGLIQVVTDNLAAMRAADVLLAGAGTATLEGMLLQVPMVITCRLSRLSAAVIRPFIRIGFISDAVVGLPNILLGRIAIPEILQRDLTGARVADEAWSLLNDPNQRAAQKRAFEEATERLHRRDTIAAVADAVLLQARRTSARA